MLDIRDVMQRGAVRPTRGPDIDAAWRRGRRRRQRNHLIGAAMVALVVATAVGAVMVRESSGTRTVDVVGPPTTEGMLDFCTELRCDRPTGWAHWWLMFGVSGVDDSVDGVEHSLFSTLDFESDGGVDVATFVAGGCDSFFTTYVAEAGRKLTIMPTTTDTPLGS